MKKEKGSDDRKVRRGDKREKEEERHDNERGEKMVKLGWMRRESGRGRGRRGRVK